MPPADPLRLHSWCFAKLEGLVRQPIERVQNNHVTGQVDEHAKGDFPVHLGHVLTNLGPDQADTEPKRKERIPSKRVSNVHCVDSLLKPHGV